MGNILSEKPNRFWRGGRIPYVILGTLPASLRQPLRDAMDIWEDAAPVRFIEKTNDDEYWLNVGPARSNCHSTTGRGQSRNAGQTLTFTVDCKQREMLHELGHTIGLRHEHSREDRDDHIQVYPDRIRDGERSRDSLRNLYSKIDGIRFGDYDYKSIMHYDPYRSRIDDAYTWMRRYDDASCFRLDDTDYALLFSQSRSDYHLYHFHVRLDLDGSPVHEGQLTTSREGLFDGSGWSWITHIEVNGVLMQLRFRAATGELETWSLRPDGFADTRLGVLNPGPGWTYPAQRGVSTTDVQDYFLFSASDKRLQWIRINDNGTFQGGTNPQFWTFSDDWTDAFFIDTHRLQQIFVDRVNRQIARFRRTGNSTTLERTLSTWEPGRWDRVAFAGATPLYIYFLTYDAQTGRTNRYRLSANIWTSTFEETSTLPTGMTSFVPYTAGGNRKLHVMNSAPRTRGYAYSMGTTDASIGQRTPNPDPVMERIDPDPPEDWDKLSGDRLTDGDIETAGYLLRGNTEIRDADTDTGLRRIGLEYRPENISDAQVWRWSVIRFLWAGRGANGKNWVHLLDNQGRPLYRWTELDDLPKWRACAAYQATGGRRYMVFRNRNKGQVRRHRIGSATIAIDPEETINGYGRWDVIVPVSVNGTVHLVFVNRGNGDVLIQPINQNGSFSGSTVETQVSRGMEGVGHIQDGGTHYLVFAGPGRSPEVYEFSNADGIDVDPISGAVSGSNWTLATSLGDGRAGLYDADSGGLTPFTMAGGGTLEDEIAVGQGWLRIMPFDTPEGDRLLLVRDKWNV